MTMLEKLLQAEVPQEELPIVDLFRDTLGDYVEINTLEEVQESTDLELYRALLLTVNEFNSLLVFEPNFQEIQEVTDINLLFLGATLKILTKKGIISSRNTLTYQDSGGVSVQDYDKYGRYINYFNILITSYRDGIRVWNAKMNVDASYGGVQSEYSQSSRYQW